MLSVLQALSKALLDLRADMAIFNTICVAGS